MEPPTKIMVVDDDPFIRAIVKKTLERAGHSVTEYEDGPAAVKAILHHGPDLVLLDIHMPGQSGLDVIEQIRTKKNDVPIVVLTGESRVETAVEALKLGANDIISKPFEAEELVARVETHIKIRKATRMQTLLSFAGATSHEMNQPLQAILGHIAMLKTALNTNALDHSKDIKTHLEALDKAGNQLVSLARRIQDLDTYRATRYVGNTVIIDLSEEKK